MQICNLGKHCQDTSMKADQFIFSTVIRERVSSFSSMQLRWMMIMTVKQCERPYAIDLYS